MASKVNKTSSYCGHLTVSLPRAINLLVPLQTGWKGGLSLWQFTGVKELFQGSYVNDGLQFNFSEHAFPFGFSGVTKSTTCRLGVPEEVHT
jgi:hypothetical protein